MSEKPTPQPAEEPDPTGNPFPPKPQPIPCEKPATPKKAQKA